MQRLHAPNHAERAEARDVGSARAFDVLDAEAAVGARRRRRRGLIGVQCQADGAVADGVGEDLEAAAVELGDAGGVGRRNPS